MDNDNNITVSICCQTYNHKDFISVALDSFLMQKTVFKYEILLRDDASTDGTAEICHQYANTYPDKIKLLAYTENQWQKGVPPFRDNVKRAAGKYIAICEGDDYWTDPDKLQMQVDLMEQYDSGLSFHAAEIEKYNAQGMVKDTTTFFYGDKIKLYSISDILDENGRNIRTPVASFVFRTELIEELRSNHPDFYASSLSHSFIVLWSAYNSNVLYIPKFMSVYRSAHEHSWTNRMKHNATFKINYNLRLVNSYTTFNTITKQKFDALFNKNINNRIYSVLNDSKISLKDRKDFYEKTKSFVKTRTKILWVLILKRKLIHKLVLNLFSLLRGSKKTISS